MDNMNSFHRLAPLAKDAVALFLNNYKRGTGPFAISEAIAAVRETYPLMDLSDDDLTHAIAAQAVAGGLDIDFDRHPTTKATLAGERWENEGGAIRS